MQAPQVRTPQSSKKNSELGTNGRTDDPQGFCEVRTEIIFADGFIFLEKKTKTSFPCLLWQERNRIS